MLARLLTSAQSFHLRFACGCLALLAALAIPLEAEEGAQVTTAWAYSPPKRASLPAVKQAEGLRNPIDAFIQARLEAADLVMSPPADKLTLLRRLTFDVTGLPPTLAEQKAFLSDTTPDAAERLIERLLSSPRYGERWAQHWLDVVRYAETDGFKADDHRPNAYKYRDYVIRALNANLPYDRFVMQQLSGDEVEPESEDALIATGYNRLWPDEFNAANLEQRWQEILDDLTEVTGLAFMGLTLGCARCHDHKFDPLPQNDYFRFQAFFAALLPRDSAPDLPAFRKYREEASAWEAATRDLRSQMDSLVGAKRKEMRSQTLTRFRSEIQEAVTTPVEKRTPYQEQIARMAELQLRRAEDDAAKKLPADQRKKLEELEKAMNSMPGRRPETVPGIMAVSDVGLTAPPTRVLANGDWRRPGDEVQPGFPAVMGQYNADLKPSAGGSTTGRRAALARWLTRPDHPLTARVIVNRLWQHHFGVGLVATPNDFGSQGDPPTHPELLDWLAVELVEHDWDLKHIHRLILTSAAYRQSSLVQPTSPVHAKGLTVDRENKLLWHARRRRLEGEGIRDAMLVLAGTLNDRMFGLSAKPRLPEGISKYAWKPDERASDRQRRSIYVLAKRNLKYPLFDTFDAPDLHNSCAHRTRTVTPPQALLLLNSESVIECAEDWARSLTASIRDDRALVEQAYQQAWGRPAAADEVAMGLEFIQRQSSPDRKGDPSATRTAAVADFCHALISANEFLYID